MLERSNIDKKYKWDLSVIYADETAFFEDYKKAEKLIKAFSKHESSMCKTAADFCSALDDMVKIEVMIEKLWQYSSLNFSIDTSDNRSQSLNAKVNNLSILAGTATWFVSPYILKLDSAVINAWFREYPRLSVYRRMVDKIMREKPYTLSDECEQLMSKIQDCLGSHSDIRSIFSNSDIRFGKICDEQGVRVELTDANYLTKLMSADRGVRKSAFRTIYKTYRQFANTYATLYGSRVKEMVTLSKLRGYKDSLTASTFRDEVTPKIYNNLIASVRRSLPVLYEYYELKRKALGVQKLHMYDLYTPLVKSLDREYSYEEAVDEVLKTVRIFGQEYYEVLRSGLCERGWADVYSTRGKRGGAFSSGCYGTEPYILLNYNGTFDDISTLAHEAGHSMHTWYSTKFNEPHNSSYTLFVAEVASTVNELLLAHRKLRECKSREEKLYILNNLMETYKATLFRQTMLAEFERDMHALCERGEPLTAELVNKSYYGLVRRYFGSGVVCDKDIAYEWMRVPHFYTCFYVYKYATCISAASAIVKRIETEGESYIGKYIDFLKCGDSRSPLDSLLVAEIDMTDPDIVNGAIEDFASCVKQFSELSAEL